MNRALWTVPNLRRRGLAAEHQALQARWAQDTQTLEALRTELTSARADLAKERGRREQAEAEALRVGVRSETLEQLLMKLQPQNEPRTKAAPTSS